MRAHVYYCAAIAGLWSLAGCYSGTDGANGSFGNASGSGPATAGGSAGDTDGSGETDSDSDSNDTSTDDPAELCRDEDVGPTDLRRLTAAQYDHTVRDLLGLDGGYSLGFSPDERSGAFKSNGSAPVGELQVEQYLDAAEAVATDATADLTLLLPCDAATGDTCAEEFLADFTQRAFRRPLEPGELDRVMGVYQDGKAEGGDDMTNGLRIAISGVLQSPYFLYHVEFGLPGDGDAVVELTGHELASRLSYFLWDSMPDDALFAAATDGSLTNVATVREQVDRMLADPKAQDAIGSFHKQWLGVDELEHAEKNDTLFPGYDEALAESMKEDVAKFANWVVNEGDGRLETLLTANMTLTEDPRLLALYGVEVPAGHIPGDPIATPADQRAGLLTMPGVMAEHAHSDQTSPIHRGVLLRQNFFCQQLPPPPPDVDNVPPNPDPNATTRERFNQHTEDPSCAGCHVLIDPLGFGLENYDPIGTFRTDEGALPIDASGEVVAADVSGEFDGGVELANMMAQSNTVRDCMAQQWFRFALGRIETDADDCAMDGVGEAFAESDYDVRVLLREIAVSSAFRFRRGAAE